jgi:ubiquinone/menaquinone biosynthesis C-methylase UbiE
MFTSPIAQAYEKYLVPLIFEPYAVHIAERVAALRPARVLEIACGTGVATRELAKRTTADIVATDLNQPMLDEAAAKQAARPVEWRQADAMHLPFDDASFDVVVCQFGAMFFPDKTKAFAEARRVLRDHGVYLFSVWDRIEENEFADAVTTAVATLFPGSGQFVKTIPHGYYDIDMISSDLARGGFDRHAFSTVAERSRAATPEVAAKAYCEGTPLRNEIDSRLGEATGLAAAAIAGRFGSGPVDGKIQAHIVSCRKRIDALEHHVEG